MLAANMAEIAGVVLNDLQGDGNSANDVAVVGVEVGLFQNGTQVGASMTTDGNGRYSFTGLGAGQYSVQITPDAGQQTRPGGNTRTVVISDADAEGQRGLLIDGFSSTQIVTASLRPPSSDPSSDPSTTLLDNGVLGGERDLFVEVTAGTDVFSDVSLTSGAGLLRLASDTAITGNAKVVWDGADNDAESVNPIGLRGTNGLGIDLTEFNSNTMTGIALTVGADHPNAQVRLRVYTDVNNWSEFLAIVPKSEGGLATGNVVFQFADTPDRVEGRGADFSDVGAIELSFVGVTAVDGQVSEIGVVGLTTNQADFTVLNRLSLGDHVWADLDNDGLRDPAETGLANVKLNLYEDTDRNGQYSQGVDQLLGMTTTNGSGDYLFTDLFPGKYIVQVAAENFEAGMALAGLSTSTGNDPAPNPDNDLNNDDNGQSLGSLGVVSQAIMLMGNGEPTNDGDADPNTNRTVDFGFFGFDLVIDKQVNGIQGPVATIPGEELTYSIVVTNNGPSTANMVTFTDTLPVGVTFLSASKTTGSGSVNNNGRNLTADLGSLANGQSSIITVIVRVEDSATGTLTNTAIVAAPNESNTTNNTDTAAVNITPQVDLTITKDDSDDPLKPGDSFSYTLKITNKGPSNATGVQVVDTLPAGVTFNSASRASTQSGNRLTFDLGNMASGAETTITIQVTIASTFVGTLTNVSTVSANEPETDTTNNTDSETTTVNEPIIDLIITKTDDDDPVEPGDTFTYTLNVINDGPDDATGVTITDTLPVSGVTYQSASQTPSSVAGRVITFDVGNLASGDSTQVSITVVVADTFLGTLLNEATVEGNETESSLANNRDTESTEVTVQPASLGGSVFVDANDDGNFDPGETPISGVFITLIGEDFRGTAVELTTRTNANGDYQFENLLPGTYRVVETHPSRYRDGKDSVGDNGDGQSTALDGFQAPDLNTDDDRDSDAFEGITLQSGANGTNYDFGELANHISKADFLRPVTYR